MLKYFGDYLEKIGTGALVVGIFQKEPVTALAGLIFSVVWFTLRRKEARKGG